MENKRSRTTHTHKIKSERKNHTASKEWVKANPYNHKQ